MQQTASPPAKERTRDIRPRRLPPVRPALSIVVPVYDGAETIVDNVEAYNNVLGWSGTNMRYTTIRNSEWFNNGLGIVPKYVP